MILYKYIFCKAYYFCIWAFKEKEFPWAWAGLTTSMVLVVTIITLLELTKFLMLPMEINIYGEYHGYFSLGVAVIILVYVGSKNRYLKILESCKSLTLKKRLLLRYMSIVYLVVLAVGFFWIGYLLREYNLSH